MVVVVVVVVVLVILVSGILVFERTTEVLLDTDDAIMEEVEEEGTGRVVVLVVLVTTGTVTLEAELIPPRTRLIMLFGSNCGGAVGLATGVGMLRRLFDVLCIVWIFWTFVGGPVLIFVM